MYDDKIAQDISDKLGKLIEINSGILDVKITHHNDWMRATGWRLLVLFITLMFGASAFYVDVILDGKESTFFNAVFDAIGLGVILL